jgi:hypothetical protein
MTTVTFSATFNINELFNDPQVKGALRAREMSYLENMHWLDEDLEKRILRERESRYLENLAWLDEDLEKRVDDYESWRRKKDKLCGEECERRCLRDLTRLDGSLEGSTSLVRDQKIWHCGHGNGWSNEKSKSTQDKHLNAAHDGLRDKTCSIFHAEWQLEKKGYNTQRQYQRFMEYAVEGDIIFFHCTKLGGLTHFGVYTGKTMDVPYTGRTGLPEIQTKISVNYWCRLSRSMNGTGRNSTLYEVKPGDKNYYTYRHFK